MNTETNECRHQNCMEKTAENSGYCVSHTQQLLEFYRTDPTNTKRKQKIEIKAREIGRTQAQEKVKQALEEAQSKGYENPKEIRAYAEAAIDRDTKIIELQLKAAEINSLFTEMMGDVTTGKDHPNAEKVYQGLLQLSKGDEMPI
jgi:hypothetical protein